MKNSEIKKEALQTLKGRWGKFIGMMLLYELIIFGIEMLAGLTYIGSLAVIVITVPLSFGFVGQILKYTRNEECGLCDYFKIGFSNFGKSWGIFGNVLLKLIVPIIVYFVSIIVMGILIGISAATKSIAAMVFLILLLVVLFFVIYVWLFSKALLYTFAEYVGNDKTEITAKEAVEESARLMKGNRWRYIGFELSFIGWILLACLTLGIGFIWLAPYMSVSVVKFYDHLVAEKNDSVVE